MFAKSKMSSDANPLRIQTAVHRSWHKLKLFLLKVIVVDKAQKQLRDLFVLMVHIISRKREQQNKQKHFESISLTLSVSQSNITDMQMSEGSVTFSKKHKRIKRKMQFLLITRNTENRYEIYLTKQGKLVIR